MHVSTKNLKSEDYLSDVVNNLAATLPKKWYDPPNFGGLFNCSDVNSDIEFLLPDPPFTRFHGLGVSLGAALQLIHLQRTDCLLQSQGRAHQTHLQGQSRFFSTGSPVLTFVKWSYTATADLKHSGTHYLSGSNFKVIVGAPSIF